MRVKRSVVTAMWRTSPTLSSRWSPEITRTCAMSSAASISRSRLGSVLTDSTAMPSPATSESATAPSMRPVILFSRSRNMAPRLRLASRAGLTGRTGPELVQVPLEQRDLARGQPLHLGLRSGRRLGGAERRRAPPRDALQPAQGRLVVRVALEHLMEDLPGLAQVPLAQVELAEGGRAGIARPQLRSGKRPGGLHVDSGVGDCRRRGRDRKSTRL